MRAIWRGAISFGLVSIPVKLFSATEDRSVAFHQVHREDGGRVRYQRICQACGKKVEYADLAKGYELSDGRMVTLTDEDLADLPLSSSREIDVVQFVPLEQVDPIYYAKSYYLEPDKAAKPYVLLRTTLEEAGKVAIVKVTLRNRESLATLRVREGVLVLETMLWPDEIREPDFAFLDDDVSVRSQELQMASSLVDTMTGDFEPAAFHDNYREALEKVIEAKIEGAEIAEQPAERPTGGAEVVDLMAALRASVARAKESRGEAAGEAPRKAAKKAAPSKAAKAPAGKTAAKKAAAKTASKSAAKSTGKAAAKKTAKATKAAKSGRRTA
jgi:DNA end-binding protein Ku